MTSTQMAVGTICLCALIACDPATPDPTIETATSGSVELLVDAEIAALMSPSLELFRSAHPSATITITHVSGREGMSALFSQQAAGVIVARDMLPDEDSILRDRQQQFARTHFATDALVFFASHKFPTDTLNAADIRASFMGQGKNPVGGTFVTTGVNSSVYGNIVNLVLHGEQPTTNISALADIASIRKRVATSTSLIGVGYLSQLYKADDVKLLRIGFSDTTGKNITPKPVHQAYVVQELYPYRVPLYFYLKNRPSMHNLASGVSGFIYQSSNAQRTFLTAGIVPEFAKIVLVPEGEE